MYINELLGSGQTLRHVLLKGYYTAVRWGKKNFLRISHFSTQQSTSFAPLAVILANFWISFIVKNLHLHSCLILKRMCSCAEKLTAHILFWFVLWQLISLLINWAACSWCGEGNEWQYFKVALKSIQWTLVPGPTAAELNCLQLKQQQLCGVSLQPISLNLWLGFLPGDQLVSFSKFWKLVLARCFLHIPM